MDLGKTIQEKVTNVSAATFASEAQAAVTKPVTEHPPKTLFHALAHASLAGSELLRSQDHFRSALALCFSNSRYSCGSSVFSLASSILQQQLTHLIFDSSEAFDQGLTCSLSHVSAGIQGLINLGEQRD